MLNIGILDLQGDVSEHLSATENAIKNLGIKARTFKVRNAEEVQKCQGIIISGGESTVIGKLISETGITEVITSNNIPVMGTCAGMVLLGRETDYEQPLLGLIDMKVKRNGFGRQKVSFEEKINILGEEYPGIFIRAPYASKIGEEVKVLAKIQNKVIAVAQGCHLATAFHPELTENTLIHEFFIKEVLNCVE